MVSTTAYAIAAQVPDPELPQLTLEDLGILRAVDEDGDAVTATITPTYSGCPAVEVIVSDVRAALSAAGYEPVEVRVVRDPPWSSAWISPTGREKLRAAGISVGPPSEASDDSSGLVDLVRCPACGSLAVRRLSPFGPTACTALYACRDCGEPFEHLKAVS